MSFFDRLFGEFVDVIEWLDDSNDTLVYRFERYGNEIKYGAKLTVREGQIAIFVNEGQVADVLSPGMWVLETKNLPVLSTLQHWDHGFRSPFKAEVYFFSTRRFTDLKWGTKKPLMLRDSEFGVVRVRAFGSYCIRIADPEKFLKEIVGTDGHFTLDEISNQLRNLISTRLATVLAASKIPALDMAANYDQLGGYVLQRIAPEFDQYGLELTQMLVENISMPAEVEEALDKRTSMGVLGNLDQYMKFQTAEALDSSGTGSMLSEGVGLGMGMSMAHQAMQQSPVNFPAAQTSAAAAPPPLPNAARQYHVAVDGAPSGPYDMQQLRAMNVTPDQLVWCEGMSGWQAAGEVDDLAPLFVKKTPPPLPPQ